MKRFSFPFFLLSISILLVCFSITEILSFLIEASSLGKHLQEAVFGGLVFLFINFCFFHSDDLIISNNIHTKSFIFSALFGFLSGFIVFLAFSYNTSLTPSILIFQKWVIPSILVSIYSIIRSINTATLIRGLVVSIVSATAICPTVLLTNSYSAILLRFITIAIFILVFFNLNYFLKNLFKNRYLRILNGKLAGYEFSLDEPQITIGSQDSDDIGLNGFEDIQPTQVKLIRYDKEYSIIDNDSTGKTFVNFRSIQEQLLKSGDILKIGSSLLQYCIKPYSTKN